MSNNTVNKIYLRTSIKNGLHFWFDDDNKHYTLRFAGKPSLILEGFRNKYGAEGDIRYIELLRMLEDINKRGLSPFVIYVNDKIEIKDELESI